MPVSKPLKAILRYTLVLVQTKFPFPSISEKSFQKMPQNIENINFTQDVDMMKSASFYFEY